MSKKLINPQGRIKILSAAQKRAKSVFKKDEVLSARPMCEVLSVSWGTLKNWCEEIEGFEASGAFTRGGEGIKWNFKVHETIEYLLAWAKSAQTAEKAQQKRVSKLVGIPKENLPATFNLDDLQKSVRIQREFQSQKIAQGKLCDVDVVSLAFTLYNSTVQQTILDAAQRADPNGIWKPEIRESFENELRNILLSVERAAQDCVNAISGSATKSRAA